MNAFNLAAGVSIATAGAAAACAVGSFVVGRAQDWRELRWFSLVALCTAAYSMGNVATVLGAPDPLVILGCQVQLAAMLVLVWALLRIADLMTGFVPGRAERWLRWTLPAGAALSLAPGLVYGLPVATHAFPPWGAVYRDPFPTPLASALYLLALATAPPLAVRLFLARRRGVPFTGRYALSVAVLTVLGTNDALAISRYVEMPYLLDVGAMVPVGTLASIHLRRFLADAASLVALRSRLEHLVEQRTRALSQAHAALRQGERLASFGRFASGMAHQVNNPAAVVQSTLHYLREELAGGRTPPDAAEVVAESEEAMARIGMLARRLVDAGRLAERPLVAAAAVAPVIRQVAEAFGPRAAPGVAVDWSAPPDLSALLAGDDLRVVLEALVANALAACPPGRPGKVELMARADDERVLVEVTDDGTGMEEAVLAQAFEPFFTTRAGQHGTGLGLPIARVLVENAGGTLELTSRPGMGTRAVVTLRRA